MPDANILATRQNAVLDARAVDIRRNILCQRGGSPYIAERLCRFPSESEVDWSGAQASTPSEVRFSLGNAGHSYAVGRKERAFLVNYAARITAKINQYVFKQPPAREGLNTDWAADVTRTGTDIDTFMSQASTLLTVAQWCWIGVERPRSPLEGRSVAARESSGDRVYWQLYDPTEVVDWHFGADGGLAWLMTERETVDNSDPRAAAVKQRERYLYERGQVTRMVFNKDGDKIIAEEVIPLGIQDVPFVLCGSVSPLPWWFDDVERVQRAIMDLHSSLHTSIYRAIFPLLVTGQAMLQAMSSQGVNGVEAVAKIGTGHPIVEGPDETGVTRWLSGAAADLPFIRSEIDRLSSELYEIVGLAMATPTRQVASADAKEWDHLDVQAVLAERAGILETAERAAVGLSVKLGGPVFTPYEASYSRKFDVTDFASDIAAIVETQAMASVPPSGEKLLARLAMRSLGKRFGVEDEELQVVLDEIDTQEDKPEPTTPPPQEFTLDGPSPDGGSNNNTAQ